MIKKRMEISAVYLLLFLICTIAAAIFSFMSNYAAKSEQKASSAQSAAQQTAEINKLGGLMGNDEMAKRYLELRRASQQFGQATIEAKVDQALKAKHQHAEFRNEVAEANEKFAIRSRIKLQPVQDLITDSMDAWIAGLEKRGVKIEYKIQQHDVIKTDARVTDSELRVATFANSSQIVITMTPATTIDARMQGAFELKLFFCHGGNVELQWGILSLGNYWQFENQRPALYPFKSFQMNIPDSDTPIDNAELSDKLRNIIDDTFGYLVNEVEPDLK